MGLQSLDESLQSFTSHRSKKDCANRKQQNDEKGDNWDEKETSISSVLRDNGKRTGSTFQYNIDIMKRKSRREHPLHETKEIEELEKKSVMRLDKSGPNKQRLAQKHNIKTQRTNTKRFIMTEKGKKGEEIEKGKGEKIAEYLKEKQTTGVVDMEDNKIREERQTDERKMKFMKTSDKHDESEKRKPESERELKLRKTDKNGNRKYQQTSDVELIKGKIYAYFESLEKKEFSKATENMESFLDSNRYLEESKRDITHTRRRHQSETVVKEPCREPVEHEEYIEKRDFSKDELFDHISGDFITEEIIDRICRKLMNVSQLKNKMDTADVLITLMMNGTFTIDQFNAEFSIITHSKIKTLGTSSEKGSEISDVEDEYHYKVYSTKEDKDKEKMAHDEKGKEKVDPEKEDENEKKDLEKEVIGDDEMVDKEKRNEEMKLDEKINVLEQQDKCINVENSEERMEIDVDRTQKEMKRNPVALSKNWSTKDITLGEECLTCFQERNSLDSMNYLIQIGRPTLGAKLKAKCRKGVTVYTSQKKNRHGPRSKGRLPRYRKRTVLHCKTYVYINNRPYRKRGNTGNQNDRSKGDKPNGNELTDSESDRYNSRGSQRSDDQEETEKEKRGRKENGEKDRDENEEPPVDNINHGNKEDRAVSTLGMIPDFKFRRKHGNLDGGQARLSDMLGLMLNESDELKVPPDIFEEINLCLMTSMQVKSAGETTTCFICTHVSALICHFGACSSGYSNTCSLCWTLFRLIQKHCAICGLSDSLTSDITCPVIICIKIKRTEINIENAEKVWKKLKKNLARFAYPETTDDDLFYSMDSMISGRNPLMPRHGRLSTVTRPILESIPETGAADVKVKSQRKVISSSEPIMKKNPDGTSVMMAVNLPKRLQHDDMPQYSSIPNGRERIKSSSGYRMVLKDIATDSTDYHIQQEIGHELRNGEVIYDRSRSHPPGETRPRFGSEADGTSHNSLPLVANESPDLSMSGSDCMSLPGRVYGEEEGRAISIQIGGCREVAERYTSLWDRPIGIPGIQDVVYGERSQLLHVARIWHTLKNRKDGKKYDAREEGVILPAYMDRLKILKMRYSKNFQWVRLSHLGSGTSGKCHLAMDFNTEFKFCIKKIHLSKYEVKEIEIWSELRHKNIVQLIGTLRRGEKIYILQEFIDGGCLTETINSHRTMNRRLSQWTALNYLKQILEALVYLEKKYVVHEDLKADNILVRSGTRDIVITDFGVARKLTISTDKRGATPSGSQIVFSPEKARGEGHGYKSDLWSAVCVLYHMLTGYPPWVRKYPNLGALLYVIIEQNPDIPENVGEEVKDLIKTGFCKDPGRRPSSEQLLQHPAFRQLAEVHPENIYSVLHSSPMQTADTKLKIQAEDQTQNEAIIEEIAEELKSIHVSQEFEIQNRLLAEIPPEHDNHGHKNNSSLGIKKIAEIPPEHDNYGNKNNSSLDIKKIAEEYGISIPENLIVKEEEPPENLYQKFLMDGGEIALPPDGLEEFESSTDCHSSEKNTNHSDMEFEIEPHSDLPKFELLFPPQEVLTEREKMEKQEADDFVEKYQDSVLITQLSRTESQHNQSFESSRLSSHNESSDSLRKDLENMAHNTKNSLKSSLDVPNLTVFNETSSLPSSDKLTIKNTFDSKSPQVDTDSTTTITPTSVTNTISLPSSSSSPVGTEILQRPASISPSVSSTLYSIDEDIDDNHLFGSGEGEDLIKNKIQLQSKDIPKIVESKTKKIMPNKSLNLHLDLSPATRRKKYAESRSEPETANLLHDVSPIPPTQPYYTPQVTRPPPFLASQQPVKPLSTSGLGSSFGRSPPRQGIDNDTSGAWSSPKSAQEEIEKYLEQLSNTSGTDIHISQEPEDHAKFNLGDDSDDEASMMYIRDRYLDNSASSNDISRLTVHYKPGQTFTMGITGAMRRMQWREIIQNECSDFIHRMGVQKFLLKDSNHEILDLQKSPSQGELIAYVEEVDDPNEVPWCCEAGMIMSDANL